ncbi:hypothetical protein J7L29_03215 [Candidatus Bathyarchaeota archaeon]|nr:hypothetical protein [Candidatus Bathyarchaeota archaeon]
MTYAIEEMWIYSHPKVDVSSTVLLVGAPRSGTTWIMEIIEALGKYRVVFEPFHAEFYPEIKKFGAKFLNQPVYRPYLPINYEDKDLKEYLNLVLHGKVSGYWYSPPKRLMKNLKWMIAENVLIKDVWITRLFPWIIHRFQHKTKNFLLLLRHPCAVIESQLRTGIGNPLCFCSKSVVKEAILRQLNSIEEFRDVIDNLYPKLRNIDRSEELLAVIWSMDYFVPLYYNAKNLYNLIVYENVVLYPRQITKRMLRFLRLKADENLSELITHRAPTAKDAATKTIANVYKWKERLSKQQIDSILKITHMFNLTFYDENIEPDYNELMNWKP